jgi:hypothetical protein
MRNFKLLTVVATLALMLPVFGFAKDNGKSEAKINVSEPVQVGSTQLQPGSYKVEWTGSGDAVKVNFLQHNKVVATTDGKLIELKQPSPYTSVVTRAGAGDQKQVIEIDMANSKQAVALNTQDSSTSSGQQ